MGTVLQQVSFASGEISPRLYGRVDLSRWQSALGTCQNFIPRPYGGVENRPGLQFLGSAKYADRVCRLVPFQFSTLQTYVLEIGHLYMRIYKDGAVVVYPPGHPDEGDIVEVTTPWAGDDLPGLNYTQSADVMTMVHPDYEPQQISRTDHHLWTVGAFVNENGPFLPLNVDENRLIFVQNTDGSTPTAGVPLEPGTDVLIKLNPATRAAVEYSGAELPLLLYLEQSPGVTAAAWEVDKAVSVGDIRRANGNYYKAVNAGTTGTLRPSHEEGEESDGGVTWKYQHSGFGIVRLTAQDPVDDTEFDAVVVSTVPMSLGNTVGSNSAYKWAFEAWNDLDGYPSAVNYFQQRLVMANTYKQPQTFWMSRIDAFTDFGKNRPLRDDDTIEGTIAARQVNSIKHIIPLNDLIFNTSGAEWKLSAGQNGVIPGGVNIDAQSFYGSSGVIPITTGTVALFVQERGSVVRDLGYSFDVDGYSGSNLSQLSEHLFRGRRVKEWAYSQVPWDAVFMVMDDGTLLTLTYVRDQQVIGWARHDTDGYFESVTSISEGDEDAVYAVVRRQIDGVDQRYVERLSIRQSEVIENAFFVDSGLSYDGAPTDATTMTLSAYGSAVIYGAATDGYNAGTYSGFTLDNPYTYCFEVGTTDDLGTGGTGEAGKLFFAVTDGSTSLVQVGIFYQLTGVHEVRLYTNTGSTVVGTTNNGGTVGVYVNASSGMAGAVVDGVDSGEVLSVSVDTGTDYAFLVLGQSYGLGTVSGGATLDLRTEAGSITQTYPSTPRDLCGNLLSGGGTSCVHTLSAEEADPLGYERLTITGGSTIGFTMAPTGASEGWGNPDSIYRLNSSTEQFGVGDVGDAVVFNDVDGRPLTLTIKEYVSPAEVRVKSSFDPPISLDGLAVTDWSFARVRLIGLDHLEGKTVSVLADGNVHPQVTVEGGAIELQYPASIVHAGLPYTAMIKTLPVNSIEASVRDKVKLIRKLSMVVQESRGGFAGAGGKRYEVKPDYRDSFDIPLPPNSGIQEIQLDAFWGYAGVVTVEQTDPLPMAILSLMPDITMGGTS